VDHGLRPQSAAEAQVAAARARALGASTEIIRLHLAPGGGHAAWRRARLGALLSVARGCNAPTLALAHTADDQAETIALRLEAGSGWRGLAAMAERAPAPLWPAGRGVEVWRPLLGSTRAHLRGLLRSAGADWIEDPGNEDRRFARVRMRRWLEQQEPAGAALLAIGAAAARAAHRIDRAALSLTALSASPRGDILLLNREALLCAPGAVAARALAAAMTAVGAPAALPWDDQRATSLLHRALNETRAFTQGGVRLAPGPASLQLSRDPGAVHRRAGQSHPLLPLDPGVGTVWDGRALLYACEPGWMAGADSRGRLRLHHASRHNPGRAPEHTPAVQVVWLQAERMRRLLWRGAVENAASPVALGGRFLCNQVKY